MANAITATIITLNEEANIAAVVASALRVCNDVVVVDSCSTDRTVELAKAAGARVFVQPYLGDGPQKDFGVPHAENDWILSIDADERLEDDAVACIRALDLERTPHDAFALRRKTFIGDRWIRLWYPDHVTRLYDRRRCRYLPVPGHSHVDARNLRRLSCHLLHYSYRDLSDLVRRIDKFASRGARMLYERGKKASPLAPVSHGLGSFLRHYVVRAGFRDGLDGLTVSLVGALGSYMKYAMLREKWRSGGPRAGGGAGG